MDNFNKLKREMSFLSIRDFCDQDVNSMLKKMEELKNKEFKVAFDEMERYLDIIGVFELDNRDVHKMMNLSEEIFNFKYNR